MDNLPSLPHISPAFVLFEVNPCTSKPYTLQELNTIRNASHATLTLFSRTPTPDNTSLPDLTWFLSQTESGSRVSSSSNSTVNGGVPPTPLSPSHAEPQFLWCYDKQGDEHCQSSSKRRKVNKSSPEL
ncbi:hypothetical protein NP233_g11790 [Leucocoprinus birnbaumii]|uniref:Uncharacterized protein n=1 Tax=Leucocoprinus birnbaumii TaxID=56174 RepID=A0AAD5VFQ5_9AGAR|nr:hypothetical protein NP233_g11790 [Leucocoprinus birnbaumii]